MRWIAHDESVEYKTFLMLNKAKNIDDIDKALEFFYGPSQNFAYATKDGEIGLTIAGKFPLKSKEQGKFILDGSNPEHEWQGFIPYDHRLTVKNPKSGYVSSANNKYLYGPHLQFGIDFSKLSNFTDYKFHLDNDGNVAACLLYTSPSPRD